ncbi:MAG: hypothetical protein IJC43_01320 [Clostridia bacterium]|nr:hypothetical protein [Clostridia bacterium]
MLEFPDPETAARFSCDDGLLYVEAPALWDYILNTARLRLPEHPALERLAVLTTEEVIHASWHNGNLWPEEIPPLIEALNAAASRRVPSERLSWTCWTVSLTLGMGAQQIYVGETLELSADPLQEGLVELRHRERGSSNLVRFAVEDRALWEQLRTVYNRPHELDAEALTRFGGPIERFCTEVIEHSEQPLTGYEVVRLSPIPVLSFEQEGASYEVFRFEAAYPVEDPLAVHWQGGLWLDGAVRLRQVDGTGFLVSCRTVKGEEIRLMADDILNGAQLHERPGRIAAAFAREGWVDPGEDG